MEQRNEDEPKIDRKNATTRVKVYTLGENGEWKDKGTGYLEIGNIKSLESRMGLIVRQEDDPSNVLLESRVLPTDEYRVQQDSLLLWADLEHDETYALSFQMASSCKEVGNRIQQLSSSSSDVSQGMVMAEGTQLHLPTEVSLKTVSEIKDAILDVHPMFFEILSASLINTNYVQRILEMFKLAEDMMNLEILGSIFSIFERLFLTNDIRLVAALVSPSLILDVLGPLEYDPKQPKRIHHRKAFLDFHSSKEIIKSPSIRCRIKAIYGIQYYRDCAIARFMTEPLASTLDAILLIHKSELSSLLIADDGPLPELLSSIEKKSGTSESESESVKDSLFVLLEMVRVFQSILPDDRPRMFAELYLKFKILPILSPYILSSNREIRLALINIFHVFASWDTLQFRFLLYVGETQENESLRRNSTSSSLSSSSSSSSSVGNQYSSYFFSSPSSSPSKSTIKRKKSKQSSSSGGKKKEEIGGRGRGEPKEDSDEEEFEQYHDGDTEVEESDTGDDDDDDEGVDALNRFARDMAACKETKNFMRLLCHALINETDPALCSSLHEVFQRLTDIDYVPNNVPDGNVLFVASALSKRGYVDVSVDPESVPFAEIERQQDGGDNIEEDPIDSRPRSKPRLHRIFSKEDIESLMGVHEFLSFFYSSIAPLLLPPLHAPPTLKDDRFVTSRLAILDFLNECVPKHGHYCRSFLLNHEVLSSCMKLLTLNGTVSLPLSSPLSFRASISHIQLAVLRLCHLVIASGDETYHTYVISKDILRSVAIFYLQISSRESVYFGACLNMFALLDVNSSFGLVAYLSLVDEGKLRNALIDSESLLVEKWQKTLSEIVVNTDDSATATTSSMSGKDRMIELMKSNDRSSIEHVTESMLSSGMVFVPLFYEFDFYVKRHEEDLKKRQNRKKKKRKTVATETRGIKRSGGATSSSSSLESRKRMRMEDENPNECDEEEEEEEEDSDSDSDSDSESGESSVNDIPSAYSAIYDESMSISSLSSESPSSSMSLGGESSKENAIDSHPDTPRPISSPIWDESSESSPPVTTGPFRDLSASSHRRIGSSRSIFDDEEIDKIVDDGDGDERKSFSMKPSAEIATLDNERSPMLRLCRSRSEKGEEEEEEDNWLSAAMSIKARNDSDSSGVDLRSIRNNVVGAHRNVDGGAIIATKKPSISINLSRRDKS